MFVLAFLLLRTQSILRLKQMITEAHTHTHTYLNFIEV